MKSPLNAAIILAALTVSASAQDAGPHRLTPVPIQQVVIDDAFWSPKLKVWREVTIADCFAKFEKDGALTNFDKIRDGAGGKHGGPPWYDGLIYEMIRGCADFLAEKRDAALEARLDGYIERIAAAAAKDPDGYLNTYTQLQEPTHRWGLNGGNDVEQHDVYNAGCLIEAGVHYYRATGKTGMLKVAAKMANCMVAVIGPAPKQNVIPGHSLAEEALVRMYELFLEQPNLKKEMGFAVDEREYLRLAEFFIEARGHYQGRKSFQAYGQDHKPVFEQESIEGHAVRATLMATGVTAIATVNQRPEYYRTALRLWENMAGRKLYITGGVGATSNGEAFGPDYVLPNDGYLETCAAIGGGFFSHNMNLAFGDARFVDELELVLYNGALGHVSQAGNTYSYVNPLSFDRGHARWAWHACPCCPPMFLKLMGGLPGYIYAQDAKSVYVNLFVGSRASLTASGQKVVIQQTTKYPWEGAVTIDVQPESVAAFDLCVRVPAWCRKLPSPVLGRAAAGEGDHEDLYPVEGLPEKGAFSVKVNGAAVEAAISQGYARIRRTWNKGDVVQVAMEMPVRRVRAPKVPADKGRVALKRGPLVYAVEPGTAISSADSLFLPPDSPLSAEYRPDLLGGVVAVKCGLRVRQMSEPSSRPVDLEAIPYFAYLNRGPSELRVWIPESESAADAATVTDIRIQADQVLHPVSRFLTGACIEDVNHEIYGGLYSQMIFGESFQEPPPPPSLQGFDVLGGRWSAFDGGLRIDAGDGPKLVSRHAAFQDGAVGVELLFSHRTGENAGLIVRVAEPGPGADEFVGYEVSLDAVRQTLRLGRHRKNFELIADVPCVVPVGRWVPLEVKLAGPRLEILVDGKRVLGHDDGSSALPAGTVGLRAWHCQASYRNLWVKTGNQVEPLTFAHTAAATTISGMWRAVHRGTATGRFDIVAEHPFAGVQSQSMSFEAGAGQSGIENQGLNRWGMRFVAAKPYEGYVWVRAEKPTTLFAALESRDGSQVYAETPLAVAGNDWQRLDFTLTPSAADRAGRFALVLKQPGSVTIGHAFLQPGEWGRFKELPVRRDVAQGLIDQGITVLRYGGSMVNHGEYKWKKMIGPRDRRPPYAGTWYGYSSNGWGIFDFMAFCEAAGFQYVPDFNIDETPQDMADFIEYAKGPAGSPWGRKRVADGHAAPYQLKYLELGNEERVDESYAARFEALAEAIWAKDPEIILVVGDFAYGKRIQDPLKFRGADSGITSLAGQERILQLAKRHGREVWFDVHVNTDRPVSFNSSLDGMFSFADALDTLADGAKHKVVVFELNSGNHAQKRALANALALSAIERDGRLPIVASANGLQPDGQNNNGWDQGLLFLDPSQVWLQPPGYVMQMLSRNYLPLLVKVQVNDAEGKLDVNATRSEDGKTLVLQVVNSGDKAVAARIRLGGFVPGKPVAQVWELSGPLEAVNVADRPPAVAPREILWKDAIRDGNTSYTFPPHSFTVVRFQ